MASSSTTSVVVSLWVCCLMMTNHMINSKEEEERGRGVMVIPLTHTNNNKDMKSRAERDRRRHKSRSRSRRDDDVSMISVGSDYTMTVSVGTAQVRLYMDTGSDLVWFPCQPFQCIMCEGEGEVEQLNYLLPPSSAVSCQSHLCAAAHSSASTSNTCAAAGCPLDSIETSDCHSFNCPSFYYAYADGSLVAKLHSHTLQLGSSLLIPNFTFGCAHSALAEPLGVAGFGRGRLSMTAQLSKHMAGGFSYCLASHNSLQQASPLILGRRHDDDDDDFAYTSMLHNPKRPYLYSVALLAVSVANTTLPAPDSLSRVDALGRGGMVVDSGTTFTMLPPTFYRAVVAEFDRRVNRPRAAHVEDTTGLGPCYRMERNKPLAVPALTLHFAGNAVAALPRRNYLYEVKKKERAGCLMLMSAGADEEEEGATLGNYQQQGFEVVYDLDNRRLGFAKRKCSSLWDHNP